jgi:hypothetical protein
MDVVVIQSLHFNFVLQEDSVRNSRQWSQIPYIRPDDLVIRPDAHQSSNIGSDDMVISFELPSVSRSFKLFKVTFVRTSQQHVRTPFSVQKVKRFPSQKHMGRQLQLFGWHVYTVQTIFLIRQDVEKNCNCPDVRATSSGRQSLLWKLHAAEVQLSER